MKINNTIFQTEAFQQLTKKVIIDNNQIFYKLDNNNIIIDSSLIPFKEYERKIFNYFFKEYPTIKYIKFVRASESIDTKKYTKVLKEKHFDNNYCLSLPENIEKYMASLGKKTRMHLNQYLRHIDKEIQKNGGGYYKTQFSSENKYIFDKINDLNKERCHSKGFETGGYNLTLWDKIGENGILFYLKIGDKIVAGTIGSVYNNQFCLFAIAHDNDYGKLNPGNAILYKTIEYAINQNLCDFNFLWGGCEYKTRFGAEEIKLYNYFVYRKYFDYLCDKTKLILNDLNKLNKKILKSIFKPPYHVLKWIYHYTLKRPPKAYGYIFMLHRVDDFEVNHLWCNEHMKVTPDFLDKQIDLLKQKYDIIPLTEVPNRLAQKNKRKFIVFTMDDGYKDNYTKALPIFKKHNVPYTIFITTDFPDENAILWWYELEDLIINNTKIQLSNGNEFTTVSYKEKCDTFLKIREEILKLNQLDLENELNKLFSNYSINWKDKCKKLCLSWNDIKVLKNEPLVTIGAHTQHHYNLKELPANGSVISEIQAGINRLKEVVDINPIVFAYPFGSEAEVGDREFNLISKFDFTCACVAYGNSCNKKNINNKYALPRMIFRQDFNIEDLK